MLSYPKASFDGLSSTDSSFRRSVLDSFDKPLLFPRDFHPHGHSPSSFSSDDGVDFRSARSSHSRHSRKSNKSRNSNKSHQSGKHPHKSNGNGNGNGKNKAGPFGIANDHNHQCNFPSSHSSSTDSLLKEHSDSLCSLCSTSSGSLPKAYQNGFSNFRSDRLTLALYKDGESQSFSEAAATRRYYSTIETPSGDFTSIAPTRIHRKTRTSSAMSFYSSQNHFSSGFRGSLGQHQTFHSPLHSRLPPRLHALVYKQRESVFDEVDGTVKPGEYEYEFRPYFTMFVLAINVLLFFVSMFEAHWEFLPFKENPMLGPSLEVLDRLGAKDAPEMRQGEWWRFFTAMFLHAGVIHLVLNMVILYRMSWGMEQSFGAHRVAPIYLLSGVSASLASSIFLPTVYGVGASGAIYGLLGALFGDLALHYRSIPDKKRYILCITMSTLVGLIIGLYPLLDNFAHIGGLVCGFFSSMLFLAGTEKSESGRIVHWKHSLALATISFAFLCFWFIGGFIVFYGKSSDENWCRACHVVNCVPSPWWECCHVVSSAQGIVCERQA